MEGILAMSLQPVSLLDWCDVVLLGNRDGRGGCLLVKLLNLRDVVLLCNRGGWGGRLSDCVRCGVDMGDPGVDILQGDRGG